jgi:hypothetical protein
MIVAKPVVDKQFWILQQDDEKIGNVEACQGGGFQVKLNDTIQQYKTIRMVTQLHGIVFEQPPKTKKKTQGNDVHGYEAHGRVYNPIWDVKHRLPLYTKSKKSKSWFAAGWYQVQRGKNWKVIQDPKLIALQRYKYNGPFHTKEEANDKSIS